MLPRSLRRARLDRVAGLTCSVAQDARAGVTIDVVFLDATSPSGITIDANSQTPYWFQETHVPESGGRAEDRDFDIRLLMEAAADVSSRIALAGSAGRLHPVLSDSSARALPRGGE